MLPNLIIQIFALEYRFYIFIGLLARKSVVQVQGLRIPRRFVLHLRGHQVPNKSVSCPRNPFCLPTTRRRALITAACVHLGAFVICAHIHAGVCISTLYIPTYCIHICIAYMHLCIQVRHCTSSTIIRHLSSGGEARKPGVVMKRSGEKLLAYA